nr:hypothetical protein [Tanacetum cinerariifolium]
METEVLKFLAKSEEGSGKRYKTSGSSSFNTESRKASINLNVDVGDDEKDESSTNGDALTRLMVSEMATHNEHPIEMQKEESKAFLEIKRKEVECRERELANQEYRQRQEDIRFDLQPYDHLIGDVRMCNTLKIGRSGKMYGSVTS